MKRAYSAATVATKLYNFKYVFPDESIFFQNIIDEDGDDDGYSDVAETDNCGTASDPLDIDSTPLDTDGDMVCDELDDDDDLKKRVCNSKM